MGDSDQYMENKSAGVNQDRERELFRQEMALKCFDLIGTMIVTTDLDGNVTLVNERACRLLEMDEMMLIGQPWTEFLNSIEDRVYFEEFWLNNKQRKKSTDEIIRLGIRSKRGNIRFVEFKIVAIEGDGVPDGILLSGKDVTDYLNIQSELQHSNYQYRMLASSIPGVNLYLFDKDLKFIIAEGSEFKKLGFDSSYFEGKTIYELFDKKTRSVLISLYKVALKGKEISTEYQYRGDDYVIWVHPLYNHDGEVYAGMVVTQNVTHEKKSSERLRAARREAEQANQAKSEFLANISHEIRTPLSAIVGFTEQLLKTNLSKKQNEFAEIIEKSSEQLLALVNDLLILSKIEAGRIDFDENLFKPGDVIDFVYQSMKSGADEKGIKFKVTVDQHADIVVKGDEFRLNQILTNLVSNAIKFTEKGEIELKCMKREENGSEIFYKFEVRDTGVGIPKEKVRIIFEQFRQADSAVTKKYGGTGLGLTISKRLVEMQKGNIDVESQVGKGTVFTVTLPFMKGDEDAYQKESNKPEAISFKGYRVLVVDDDSVNRLLGQTILKDFGFEVDMAAGGNEAIRKIEKHHYDVVLLDIHMPGVSGIDVAWFLRESKKNRKTKIMAVTAAFLKEDIDKYKVAGIDDYLIKPFREVKLYRKLCKLLGFEAPEYEKTGDEPAGSQPINQQDQLYDLTELKSMAKNDPVFINEMLETFAKNLEEGIEELNKSAANKNWKKVGDIAHKLRPSLIHLKVHELVPVIEKLEYITLHEPDLSMVPETIKSVNLLAYPLIDSLKKEIQ